MSEIIDNRAHRIRTLKEVIRHLHEGQAPAEARARLKALVRECDASEIAAMEQDLIAEGVPVQQIMNMCDLHSQVVREILVDRASAPLAPGHPVETFHRENEALGEHAALVRAAFGALAPAPAAGEAAVDPAAFLECRRLFAGLMDVDKHYARKEQLLFPFLERHGITGPSKVMWGKDDEVRRALKALGAALGKGGGSVAEWRLHTSTLVEPALAALEEMIFKEEKILLPMSRQTLTEAEWAEVFAQTPQFGYCLVEPGRDYAPASADEAVPAEAVAEAARSGVAFAPIPAGARLLQMAGREAPHAAPAALPGAAPASAPSPRPVGAGLVVLPTGALSLTQLKAMFATLPVDITFVDANDRVRFFSEGRNRVFARPMAVIGRLVQHCHPPSSVDVVDRILSDFRSGRQEVAEFWIEFQGRFVHIRYFALRDDGGTYLGTLEVTQDLSRERALTGERRLLEYQAAASSPPEMG